MIYQLPQQFLDRLKNIVPSDKFVNICNSLSQSKTLAIRINTLKTKAEDLQKLLQNSGIDLRSVSWYPDAFTVENVDTRFLTNTEEYKLGLFYIQNLSSMLVSLTLDPQLNEKILDLAAAPGSKTTHIAMLMQNMGEIVANDVSRERIYKLQSNIERYGITNIKITNYPGETVWQKNPEYFDRVLLDAPCSMEGRFDNSDTTTFQDWTVKKIKKLAKQQCWLLRSAVSATKVGGTIIYSTCTLAPEENEAVIQWLLEKEKNTVQLENIDIPYVDAIDGLTQWQNKDFNSSLIKTKRILPTKEMEGFFIAKIKKIKSNVPY